jgi:DNA invertase Pin-like site-specific DNA recombinase
VAETRRAALYHRVSTLDQDPTLASSELRAAAKRLGYRSVLDVEETGSGAQNDRPGFKRVLEAARLGKIDALLVFKLDRAGRSALDLLANIRALVEEHGVRFVVTSQGAWQRSPPGLRSYARPPRHRSVTLNRA